MLEAALETCKKYGFKPIEFDGFSHPRLVFLCDDDYDYTAETFAMFNAQEIKSQQSTDSAKNGLCRKSNSKRFR